MATDLSLWRRRIGIAGALLGTAAFVTAAAMYVRYASSPNASAQHVQERIDHAHVLNILWRSAFYGSPALFLLSLFGLGWGRLLGALASLGALLASMMFLGALCGPYMC